MKKIYIVEDNETIIKGLKYSLIQEGFTVGVSTNVKDAKEKLSTDKYNLAILDITLPDGNGFELCKYIKEKIKIPVIILTAKDEESDVVQGFDVGADDYIIKPFRVRELTSRITNVLRRVEGEEKIVCGDVEIDRGSTKVYVKGEEITFTALEYRILLYLYSNKNKVISREQILSKIWDDNGNFVNDNTLTVYIKRIRNKLGTADNVSTIKGLGYRVEG